MKLGTVVGSIVLLGMSCTVVPDSTGVGAPGRAEGMKRERLSDPSDVNVVTSPLSPDRNVHDAGEATDDSGSPCGPSRCEDGQFCCNESCGLCAPRGSLCLQRQCGPETASVTQCVCDDDCRPVSNYCEGCQCLPLRALDLEPACHGQTVACLLDPCRAKHAACISGACAIVDD